MTINLSDMIAFVIFILCTIVYHVYYYYKVLKLRKYIFKRKIKIIRRTWVENMLKPGIAIVAV